MGSYIDSTKPELPEPPTEMATLRLTGSPLGITVSAQGAATRTLTLGVIGPLGTIVVGHFVGLPVWVTAVICLFQVTTALVSRWS